MPAKSKSAIIRELTRMRNLEKWAQGFYLQVVDDPRIERGRVKSTFAKIANDEDRHSKIVQRILNIINDNL